MRNGIERINSFSAIATAIMLLVSPVAAEGIPLVPEALKREISETAKKVDAFCKQQHERWGTQYTIDKKIHCLRGNPFLIRSVQKRLKDLGYFDEEINGLDSNPEQYSNLMIIKSATPQEPAIFDVYQTDNGEVAQYAYNPHVPEGGTLKRTITITSFKQLKDDPQLLDSLGKLGIISNTMVAAFRFQKEKGLTFDGIIGPEVFEALFGVKI